MRHWSPKRTECCPARSPLSSSRWLPGGNRRSSRTAAASSAESIARVRLTRSAGKPLPNRPSTAFAARLPFVLTIMRGRVSRRDTYFKGRAAARFTVPADTGGSHMAEKRVSVRLSATGGRQVKDALRGVGEAGQQGFRRLSREMEAANRRLARFARQATRIARVVGAAAAAAGAALIRSGLQTIDAQAKLAQSLATTTASVQVLARAADLSGNTFRELEAGSARLTRRLSLFAADGSGPAADAIGRLGLNAAELLRLPLDERIARVTEAIRQNAAASEQAALFSQLFGDRAFVAFQRLDPAQLRQANDELRRFGVLVSDADADRIEETNDAISRLGLIWRGLSNQLAVAAAPALQSAAEGLARLGEVGGPIQRVFTGLSDALVLLIDNVGRVASTAAAFAGFLAGRWVAGLAAAALSVRGLATALVVLRGALIRTGIGALIVGAGELIYQFTRLVAAAGGIGEALSLLKDVAAEAWDRIALRAGAAWARVEAGWAAAQATILEGLQGATEAVVGWGNSTVATFSGAFDAVKATWGALPAAIGDFAFQAANALIDGVESMINGVVARIGPVAREVWEFEVSGLKVVQS